MPRDRITRRGWLAALAGGATAGCGGRSEGRGTATPSSATTATESPTTTAGTAADVAMAGVDDSFERGPGSCTLEATPVADGTWPMSHHDPAGTNASPAANGPTGFPLNERWTMSALEATVTFPVADGDFVYLVAADPDAGPSVPTAAVLCHDPRRNGEIQWRHEVDTMPIGPPVAVADTVYVPFGSREDARVFAIGRERGERRNVYDLPGRFVGELGTVGTGLVVPSEDTYRVIDARSGEHCWSFTPNRRREADRHDRKIRAAAVGDGAAFVGTGYPDGEPTTEIGHLYAIDPSVPGLRWHASMDGPVGRIAVDAGVVVATTRTGVAGFSPRSGERLWGATAESPVRPATLAVSNGTVVYGTRRTMYGLDVSTGEQRWSHDFGVRGDVILVGDVLYAVGRSDPTSQRILLAAVDSTTGRPRWQQEIYDPIVDVMAANGYLYSITTDGRLFAFTSI